MQAETNHDLYPGMGHIATKTKSGFCCQEQEGEQWVGNQQGMSQRHGCHFTSSVSHGARHTSSKCLWNERETALVS